MNTSIFVKPMQALLLGGWALAVSNALAVEAVSFPQVPYEHCKEVIDKGLVFEFGPTNPKVTMEVLESQMTLSEKEFNTLPFLGEYFEYEKCRDFLFKTKSTLTATGEEFIMITTSDHTCDGGNTFGIVLTADESHLVANIYDGNMECSVSSAVCDTDTNCMFWEQYHEFGVAKVMYSHDDENDMRWIEVHCEGKDETFIIDDPSEMEVVCKES